MKLKYLKDVTTLKLITEKCTGCGKCTEVCPHNVFILNKSKVEIKDKDKCMECGACALNCPFSAIEVKQGVGCAAYIISGFFNGGKRSCGDSESEGCC